MRYLLRHVYDINYKFYQTFSQPIFYFKADTCSSSVCPICISGI